MHRPYIQPSDKKPKTIDPTALALSTAADNKTVAVLDALSDGVKVGIFVGGVVAIFNIFGHLASKS